MSGFVRPPVVATAGMFHVEQPPVAATADCFTWNSAAPVSKAANVGWS